MQLRLDGHFAPWKIGPHTPFCCVLEGSGLKIRVQGDSVLVFEPQQNMRLAFEGLFKPAYNRELRGNRLLLDEVGGCGFFGIPPRPTQLDDSGNGWIADAISRGGTSCGCACARHGRKTRSRMKESISHDILYNLPKERDTTLRYPRPETLRDIAAALSDPGACTKKSGKTRRQWVDDPPGSDYKHPKPWETDRTSRSTPRNSKR